MAYSQENNPFKKTTKKASSKISRSPFFTKKPKDPYKGVDFDNLTEQQKKDLNILPEVGIDRYGVDVTRYKNSLETLSKYHKRYQLNINLKINLGKNKDLQKKFCSRIKESLIKLNSNSNCHC